jgi:hypothetical protein
MSIAVYVPKGAARWLIARGSGVVGSRRGPTERVTIDYEGNLYGAVNLACYANRVARAYYRHATDYPTVARAYVPPEELLQVGWYEPGLGQVTLFTGGAVADLAEWLDVAEIDPDELVVGR